MILALLVKRFIRFFTNESHVDQKILCKVFHERAYTVPQLVLLHCITKQYGELDGLQPLLHESNTKSETIKTVTILVTELKK